MRVAIVKDNMSVRSGTSKMCVRIALGFQALGDEVRVIYLRRSADSDQVPPILAPVRFSVLNHPTLSKLSELIQTPVLKLILSPSFTADNRIDFIGAADARGLSRELSDPDLLVFMNLWSAPSLLLGVAGPRTRVITMLHEPPIFTNLPFPLNKLLEIYFRSLSRTSQLLVTPTEDTAQYTKSHFGCSPVVVPNGSWIPPREVEKEPIILADTRWTADRDPRLLLRIAERVEDASFVVSGTFPSRRTREEFMEDLRSTGLRQRVKVLEGADETTIESIFSRSLIYVRWGIQTREYGPSFGLSQAISNLCVPIVSSDLGSATYVRSRVHSGLVVEKSASSFASVIDRILNDLAFRESVQMAVREARDRYTWKDYAGTLRALAFG
jgi:glycosyltransferase involved in cell wall biosynthesis